MRDEHHVVDELLDARVPVDEAVDRRAQVLVEPGRAREEAEALARTIAAFPPRCVRSDRRSAWESVGFSLAAALAMEFTLGKATVDSGESQEGAGRFASGAGRHGQF